MNKNTIPISDHLLAKFLDGKTDARETEQVLSYLNENNENLEDFMNIRSAILIDTEPPIEIDLNESLDIVKQHINTGKTNKKSFQKRIYFITSFAAAAMVAGIVFLIAFYFSNNDKKFTAQDEIIKEEIQNVYQDSISELPKPENRFIDNKELANNELQGRNKLVSQIEEEEETEIQILHKNTALKTEINLFEMVKPYKTPYIVEVKNLEKYFDFKWKTNAEKIEVTLKDKKGNILESKEVLDSVYQIKYLDYYKYLEIYWEMKATFQDGTEEKSTGVLQLMVD
ncbi:MAG: hypothetical protein FWH59_01705 [Lentimicrobiaceae bacterium]|nr:hypothetical protein [Lentimicrobiaceae bacterium]